MSEFLIRWHAYANTEQLIEAVVNAISAEAVRAITTTGSFLIVLAGGSTPRSIYAQIVELDMPWSQWHVYFGDERCLSAGHPQRNDIMAPKSGWIAYQSLPTIFTRSRPNWDQTQVQQCTHGNSPVWGRLI